MATMNGTRFTIIKFGVGPWQVVEIESLCDENRAIQSTYTHILGRKKLL